MGKKELHYWRRDRELFFMSLPAIIYKLVFAYFPLFFLIIAFKDYRFDQGVLGSKWVGLKNFTFFFSSDSAFVITRNTILYNLAFIILTTIIGLVLAILMNEISKHWLKIHQTILFLPYFLSWVVVGYIVLAFLDHRSGLLNQILASKGLESVKWYQKAVLWPFIIIIVQLWKAVGYTALIYYAGILGIDASYYEAARLDGASKWKQIIHITIPSLTPLIIILFLVDIGRVFRSDFGLFYFVPNNVSFLYSSTDVIDTYVYRSLRVVGDLGMSSAIGLYQSAVGLVLVLLVNYVIRKVNQDHALW